MAEYTTRDIRNVVAAGHGGSGKTTLFDHVLFKAGAVNRAGSVDEKTSVFDFEDEEKEKLNSIFSAHAFCAWKDVEFNLIDAPGYTDYVGSAISALRAADTALITVSAPAGIELNTRKMWAAAKERVLAVLTLAERRMPARGRFEKEVSELFVHGFLIWNKAGGYYELSDLGKTALKGLRAGERS